MGSRSGTDGDDGVRAPRAESFQLLRRIRAVNIKTAAYCGIDLHKRGQAHKPVYVEVEAEQLQRDAIIRSLGAGRFTVRGSNLTIPSTGNLTFS